MKQVKRQRSAMPVYLLAAVWAVAGFGFHVHTGMGYAVTAIFSVAVFLLSRLIWKDRMIEIEVEEKKAEPDKPKEPENPELAQLMQERDRALSEMRRLNDNIKDEKISAQIDRIEATTGKIFAHVLEHPEKKGQIRRFLNYYLPTTIKLLNAYDRMDDTGVGGENIDGTKGKIETMLDTIAAAFDKQLDALFQDEAMDISSDITVLEQLMAREGLTDEGMNQGAQSAQK